MPRRLRPIIKDHTIKKFINEGGMAEVWHAVNKGMLREEIFRYNNKQVTLIYEANKKHTAQSIMPSTLSLTTKHDDIQQDKSYRWATKSIRCNHTHLKTILTFHKSILIPITGFWDIC